MRRISTLLTVTAVAAVGLVGCSSTADSASCARPSDSPAILDLVEVSGSTNAAPRVSVRTPLHVNDTTSGDVVRGDGVAITDSSQLVHLDVSIFSGETGEEVIATRYDGNPAGALALSQFTGAFPGLEEGLECATGGSRVVVALAPEGIDPAAAQQFGLADDESAVAVVDLHKVYLAHADGADQYTESHGLPTVVRAPDGRPGVIIPEAAAPTEPVVQVLKRGDGPEVSADGLTGVHLTAVGWDDARVLNSTWESAPQLVMANQLPQVISDALVGQTVGSQVLVVVPAEAAGGQGAPAQTTVYVFDILGADEA